MKGIKLFAVFVGIVAIVAGVFFLSKYIGDDNGGGITGQHSSPYVKLSNDIDKEWEAKGHWDEDTYDTLYSRACQLKDADGHNESDARRATLITANTNAAVALISKDIFAEWKKTDCHCPEIERLAAAITFIESKDEGAKDSPEVQKIKRVKKVYDDAYALIYRKIGLSPHYDGYHDTWESFATYRKGIEKEEKDIEEKKDTEGDPIYTSYLSNIKELKDGLSGITGKLTSAKTSFYKELAKEIQDYYKPRPRTQAELSKLRQTRNKFGTDKGSSDDNLQKFVNTFRDEVDAQQVSNN